MIQRVIGIQSVEMRIKEGWEGIVLGAAMLLVVLSLILGFRFVLG